jgi:hypothetical protein
MSNHVNYHRPPTQRNGQATRTPTETIVLRRPGTQVVKDEDGTQTYLEKKGVLFNPVIALG